MPKPTKVEWPLRRREDYFLTLYIKKGAVEKFIPQCEKSAQLPVGAGAQLLRTKRGKDRLAHDLHGVIEEQKRQSIISDSVDAAALVYGQKLQQQIARIASLKIQPEVLKGLLMEGALVIDWQTNPGAKLDVIKTGLIVDGLLEGDRMKRLLPAEDIENSSQKAPGVYQSVFGRQPPPAISAPLESNPRPQDDGVFDIFPPAPTPEPPAAEPKSEPEPEPEPKSKPAVITVHVG